MQELLEKGNIRSNTYSCGSPNILDLNKDGSWKRRSPLVKSQAKYKDRHGKRCVDHNFQVGDEVRLCINKENLQGEENLKLYEPTLFQDQGENAQIPSIAYFFPEYIEELQQDTILDRKERTSRRGNVKYLHMGLKGTNTRKYKWIEIGSVREMYPHLFFD